MQYYASKIMLCNVLRKLILYIFNASNLSK